MQSPRSPLCFVNRFVSFKRDWAKYYPSECFLIPRDDNYKKGHKNIWLRGFLTNEILFLLSKEIVCCWKRLLSTRPELPRTQNPVNCELPRAQDCEPRAILKWATSAHLKRTLTSNQHARKSPTFGSSEYSQFGSVFASHILKGFWTLSVRKVTYQRRVMWQGNYAFQFWQHRNFGTKNSFIVEKPTTTWSKSFCVDLPSCFSRSVRKKGS